MAKGILEGRSAIVTGGGDGIGKAMASRFASQGAAVLIAEYNEETGRAVADGLRASGLKAEFFRCDVTIRDDVENMIATCADHFGSVDILVNNAFGGSRPYQRIEKMDDSRFEHHLRISFWAGKWSMTAAFPHMRAKGWGRIINICSMNGVNAHIGSADYNVGKEALRAYTRTAAREWAGYGICANIICPAAASASYKSFSAMQPELAASTAAANPMGRVGDPDADIAGVALFLASEDARYMTGSTLFADGGSHINGITWAPELPDE